MSDPFLTQLVETATGLPLDDAERAVRPVAPFAAMSIVTTVHADGYAHVAVCTLQHLDALTADDCAEAVSVALGAIDAAALAARTAVTHTRTRFSRGRFEGQVTLADRNAAHRVCGSFRAALDALALRRVR